MHARRKIFGSLQTRLTLATASFVLIGIWALAFSTGRMLLRDMTQQLGAQQLTTASIVANQINEALEDRFKGLTELARQLHPAMLKNGADVQMLLAGSPVVRDMFNGGTFVTQADGTVTASDPLGAKGRNYLERDCMATALKEGRASVGRPVIDKLLSKLVVTIAVPVRDPHGSVIGALAGVIDLDKPNFLDNLTHNHYGQTGGYVLVAPQDRLVVTATDKSLIMTSLPDPGGLPTVNRPGAGGHGGFAVFVNPAGIEVLAAMQKIPSAGWSLIVALPTQEAFAPLHTMQRHLLLAAILLTLCIAGLTGLVARRLLAPMATLTAMVTAMAAADQPPQSLPVDRDDEIGQLVNGFNLLLIAAKQRHEALRDRQGTLAIAQQASGKMDDRKTAHTICQVRGDDQVKKIETLQGALDAGDVAYAGPVAHTIQGAAAESGGEALPAAALAQEQSGKVGDLEAAARSRAALAHYLQISGDIAK